MPNKIDKMPVSKIAPNGETLQTHTQQCKNSRPISDAIPSNYPLKVLVPRISNSAQDEGAVIRAVEKEWLDRGGYPRRPGSLSKAGGMTSLCFPEANPVKLPLLWDTVAFGLVDDDCKDNEISPLMLVEQMTKNTINPSHYASTLKNCKTLINQMKAERSIRWMKSKDEIFYHFYDHWAENQPPPQLDKLQSLDEYLEERSLGSGWSGSIAMMPYLHDLNVPQERLDELAQLDKVGSTINSLVNDMTSAGREWLSHSIHGYAGVPRSSFFIFMRDEDVSVGEAYQIMKAKILEYEQDFVKLRTQFLDKYDTPEADLEGEAMVRYIWAIENFVSGWALWHASQTERYFGYPTHPLSLKPEYKLASLPRNPRSNEDLNVTEPESAAMEDSSETEGIINALMNRPGDAASLPPKKVIQKIIDALDYWYRVPEDKIDIISKIINYQYASSIRVADGTGSPEWRAGNRSTRLQIELSESMITSELFMKCFSEAQKLSSTAVEVFQKELMYIAMGRSRDQTFFLLRDHPQEREYIQTIDGSNGGLFRLASRLMRTEATQNKSIEVENMLTIMSRLLHITTELSAAKKGNVSDFDKGAYSFLAVRALCKNGKESQELKELIRLRAQAGSLTTEQKLQGLDAIKRSKSIEETIKDMQEGYAQIETKLDDIDKELKIETNWTMRLLLAKLKIKS